MNAAKTVARPAEGERPDDAVAKRLALLLARQTQHEDGQHQGVVGAEQPFEQDQEADGEQIGCVKIHDIWGKSGVERPCRCVGSNELRVSLIGAGKSRESGRPRPATLLRSDSCR